jgi:predicted regulator of Ras-like GTPase activity (Roadblock/LC7/MglB family)
MNVVITRRDLEKIADRSGQLIAHQGQTPDVDILALAALTAANFGATAEIARLLGEEEFTLLFHKGRSENVYFSTVGEHTIMVTLFDDKTSLGLIRLKISQIIDELSTIVGSIFEKGKKRS